MKQEQYRHYSLFNLIIGLFVITDSSDTILGKIVFGIGVVNIALAFYFNYKQQQ